ncbi:MAG: hypothetical protein AB1Z98_09805 [Nannocystaceae bacterium]
MIPKFEASSYELTPYVDARNLIGGEWTEPSGDQVLPVENPRHGEPM